MFKINQLTNFSRFLMKDYELLRKNLNLKKSNFIDNVAQNVA